MGIWILAIFNIVLLIRLISINKEIRSVKMQLDDYNNLKSYKKVDINLFNKNIENLAYSINRNIDMNIKAQENQKRLENEMKKAIANISHDLRTPLTSVIGYIQMLKKKNLPKNKVEEYLEIAERRAKSLQILLNQFFELSVIDSPEYKMDMEYVNLNNILVEVITSFYEKFIEKNIEPAIDIIEESLIVIGNGIAIKRVIENLIINIIKHSQGEISIKLKKEENRGILITKNLALDFKGEDSNMIFNRFYKGDMSRSNGNTGLGLSIVKGLMDKMDGEIYSEFHDNNLYIICKWNLK